MTTDVICLKQKKGAFCQFLQIVYLDFSLRKTNKQINKLPNLKTG